MLPISICLVNLAIALTSPQNCNAEDKPMSGALDFTLKDIEGKDVPLSEYKGKVILIVNVASECGYTPQYNGLQTLYDRYGKLGLVIVGIPSNEFGRQEPGSNEDILKFCRTKYKVTFPMMSKAVIKGEGQIPLYKFLTEKETNPKFAGDVGWNFEKFLISRSGEVVGRYKSGVEPLSKELVDAITNELQPKGTERVR
jgi:glutathione peroxidase